MNASLLLKFFSGPNAGAEVLLGDGEYVVGSDSACDLVLDDHLVIDRHVLLKVSGSTVECTPFGDARVFVEGRPTDGTRLAPFDFVTIGGTSFAVGGANAAWPMRPLPALQIEAPVAETPPEPAAPSIEVAPEVNQSSVKPRRWIWAASSVVVAIGLIGVGVAFFVNAPKAQAKDDTAERLRKALEWAGASESVTLSGEAPNWTVEGRVPQKAVKDKAEKEVRRIAPAASIRIWDDETLTKQAEEILRLSRFPSVTAKVTGDGELVLDGETTERDRWKLASERLKHDLVGLRNVVDRVVVRTPTPNRPQPVVASLTPKPTPPPAAPPPTDDPRDRITGVSVGAERWITMTDGARVGVGGRFPGGFEVAAITHDYVDLVKDRQSVRHFWRENRSAIEESPIRAIDTASR